MSSEESKILELNQYQKIDKAPFVICTDVSWKKLMDTKIILKIHPQQK